MQSQAFQMGQRVPCAVSGRKPTVSHAYAHRQLATQASSTLSAQQLILGATHQCERWGTACQTRTGPRAPRSEGLAPVQDAATSSVHQRRDVRTQAASGDAVPAASGTGVIGTAQSPLEFASAFYRFTRPHTMIGTWISVTAISLLALQTGGPVQWAVAWQGYLYALSSALLMNICIVGINQVSDIEIDKVNKPYLPLASGEFSKETGIALTVGTGALSILICLLSDSPALTATVVVSLLLGIVYSIELPFMRWKRSPVLAAGCILVVRALAVQLGFYFHMQTVLARQQLAPALAAAAAWKPVSLVSIGAGMQVTPAILFTLCFMLLFSVVIALFKDIPDSLGDRAAGVRTLTVRWGVKRVFWTCIWILTAAYAGAVTYSVLAAHFWATVPTTAPLLAAAAPATAAAAAGPAPLIGAAMPASLSIIGGSGGNLGLRVLACVAGHCLLAGLLWQRALKTDLSDNKDISACYMHVWKLFYAEYILIPLLL